MMMDDDDDDEGYDDDVTRVHAATVLDIGPKVACSSSPSKRTEKTFSLCMSAMPEHMHRDIFVIFHGGAAFTDCN